MRPLTIIVKDMPLCLVHVVLFLASRHILELKVVPLGFSSFIFVSAQCASSLQVGIKLITYLHHPAWPQILQCPDTNGHICQFLKKKKINTFV